MKRILQSFALLMALLVPVSAHADYVQLANGVYQDGTALYISRSVTTLGSLQVNPEVIYCYATIPPSCMSNTFTDYSAALHVPASAMVSYFSTQYWYNFNDITADAIEPLSVTMNTTSAELEVGGTLVLTANVLPSNATPATVVWSSTDELVATVNDKGTISAIGTGECDIIATCVDKQAVCHLTVVPERVTITLDRHVARLLTNHTMTLTATCSPATTDLVVTSSDPTVAVPRYVNGTIMVVGVGEGTATVTVSTTDGWCNSDACEITVFTEIGDVNNDGFVNISDVTALIDYILSDDASSFNADNADTNRDGNINISDVTMLIDYLLDGNNIWPWQTETFTVNGVSFTMVNIEGGTFMMGATAEQTGDTYDNEYPVHEVTLSSYSIGQTEVTQALWQAVMESNPSNHTGNLSYPVEKVSWNDCQIFISKLNQMTGKRFRLLTEAEWEFAARGGNKSQGNKYAGSDNIDVVAWYDGNSGNVTHSVATKIPNELGLYDMTGNVWEWVQDWFDSYNAEIQINPTGPTSGSVKVHRGGGEHHNTIGCRISYRGFGFPSYVATDVGLRLALDPDDNPKFRLSETVMNVWEGESKSINILNGNGSYTLVCDTSKVNVTADENTLIVTGIATGTITVYITDNTSGSQTFLNVIVTEQTTPQHEYVDLGLPSGTLWATMNVGANAPEDYGDYFAWGETEPKDLYDLSNYKWCSYGSRYNMTKYCTESHYGYNGFTDGKTELDPEDDAAYVNWGPSWRMPTKEQQQELIDNCTWIWTTMNDINGYLVIGPNENTLFLPAAGHYIYHVEEQGSYGSFWSRTLYLGSSDLACFLGFISGNVDFLPGIRSNGKTVRAVRVSQN